MNESKTGRWAQALGFLGVIVSLLFVAYELKQARDIALAEVYQQKTALVMDINTALIDSPALLDAYIKLWESPEILERQDFTLINGDLAAQLAYWENNHFLYQLEMITEEQMNTLRSVITSALSANYARHYWMATSKSGDWRESFATEVNRLLAEAGPVEARRDSANLALRRTQCSLKRYCRISTLANHGDSNYACQFYTDQNVDMYAIENHTSTAAIRNEKANH